ncbi:MAG TPA: prolyl oligopeptidase family serine peptidase [Myxococcota bacterium]
MRVPLRFVGIAVALLAPAAARAAEPARDGAAAPAVAAADTGAHAPAAALPPLELSDFARHPFATLPTLSPDGSQIAAIYRTEKARALAVRGTAADADLAPQVLSSINARPRWTQWTKEGRILASVERWWPRTEMNSLERPPEPPRPIYDRRGNIVGWQIPPQPQRKALPEGRLQYLVSFSSERARNRHLGRDWEDPVPIQDDVLSWLPADPRKILISYDEVERFASQRVTRPAARAMSVTTGGLRTIVAPDRRVQRWYADHDGEVRLGEGVRRDGSTILYRRNGRELIEVPTYVQAIEADLRFAAYSYDPDVIYAWAPVQGRQALVALRLSDVSVDGIFASEKFDVTGPLVFDETARKLVGVGFIDDVPQLHALDESLALEREQMARAVPGVVLEYVSESADKKLLLVRASSDVRPPAYYLFDRTKREMRLELVEYPRLEGEALQPMEPVHYFARDGLEIPAYLTRPPGPPVPGPAIVLVHDGPDQRAYRRFDPLVQWLAHCGFTVLEPNYRGSSGYGDKLRSAGHGDWGGAMQNDLEDAAAWLVKQRFGDPKRIGIYGRGYGGYAALMGVLRETTPFRAAASYGAPTDLEQLLEDDENSRVEPDWSRRVLGARKLRGKQLLELSPISHVSLLDRPVLLLHSAHDERVRVDHAERLAKLAAKAGKPVEFVEFEGELHELAQEGNRMLWFDKLTQFFETTLAPAAPDQPAPPVPTQENAS